MESVTSWSLRRMLPCPRAPLLSPDGAGPSPWPSIGIAWTKGEARAMKSFTEGQHPDSARFCQERGMPDFPLTDEEKMETRLHLHELEMEHHDLDDIINRL